MFRAWPHSYSPLFLKTFRICFRGRWINFKGPERMKMWTQSYRFIWNKRCSTEDIPKSTFYISSFLHFPAFRSLVTNRIWFSMPHPFKFPFSPNRVTLAFITNICEILMILLVKCPNIVTWWEEKGPEGLLYGFNFIHDLSFGHLEAPANNCVLEVRKDRLKDR